MTWISATEQSGMQDVIGLVMPDTCVIQQSAYTPDGEGGGTVAWASVTGGTVACRFDTPKPGNNTIVFASGESLKFEGIFTLPHDAPLATNNRIVYASKNYEIVGLGDAQSWNICRKVYANLVVR
jgi:hypothetical protein